MARYKDRVNYKPHNINNTTVQLNGTVKVTGLERFEAELMDDENSIETAADGLAIIVENPKRVGTITIQFLEASAVTDEIFTLLDAGDPFAIGAIDDAASNFDVRGQYCVVQKRPAVIRGELPDKPEWIFLCPYLTIKGGSYALATV